jgi:hypothetical protein
MDTILKEKRDIGDAICEALVTGAARNAELVKEVGALRIALAKIREISICEPNYVNAIKIEGLASDALRGESELSSPSANDTQQATKDEQL